MARKEPRSYLANAALSCAALYFAQDLSRGDRGAVDWTVLGLVTLAVLWNLFRLGQRLHAAGGDKALGHLLRTLLFWIVGLFNTVLIRPEEVGSWKNIVGWVLLVAALLDSVALAAKERGSLRPSEPGPDGPS